MRVRELIDILMDKPPDADVEVAFVTPVDDEDTEIVVNHFDIAAVYSPGDGDDNVLLIAGEEDDIDELIDSLESTADDLDG